MFKISPIQDKDLQRKYAKACGAKCHEDLFAYAMIDQESGELMGFSEFDISADCGYIKNLRPRLGYSDFEAMFILGRATMNFIDLCGNHVCRAANDAAEERLIKAIGFKLRDDGEYFADMTDMFSGHCDGKTVDLDKK